METAHDYISNHNSLKDAFLACLDTEGVYAGKTHMGTLGSHYYEGNGAQLWHSIARDPDYYVSRESLLLAKKASKAIFKALPRNAEVYMLGTSNEEALCFAQSARPFHQINILDVSPEYCEEQRRYVRRGLFGQIKAHCINFQEQPLPESKATHKIIVYPSANIGNVPAYWGQSITRNEAIINQLKQFRSSADVLLIGYDANQNARHLESAYGSTAHDNFVLSVFERIKREFNLASLDVTALKRIPEWKAQNSALLHTVISTRKQEFMFDGQDITIEKDQPLYPGLSQKFGWRAGGKRDMDMLAEKAGWVPIDKPYQLGLECMVLQAYI